MNVLMWVFQKKWRDTYNTWPDYPPAIRSKHDALYKSTMRGDMQVLLALTQGLRGDD